MSQDSLTRRDLLRGGTAASGTVVLGSLTGCLDSVPFLGGGGGSVPDPSGTVPENAEAVVTMDFAGMIGDADLKDIGNTLLSELSKAQGYSGPTSVDAWLDEIEKQAGLDPRGLKGGVTFMRVSSTGGSASQQYAGVIVNTEWTESGLVDALEQSGTSLSQGTYAGKTVYEPRQAMGTGSVLGVLSEGQFAFGTRSAVEDAIDVSAGNVNPLSGAVVNNLNSVTTGYMEFSSIVPESQLPSRGSGGMQIKGLSELEAVSGSVYKAGGNFGIEVNMHTATSQAATDLSNSLEDLTGVASMATQDSNVLTAIEKIRFSASGTTATVSYEESISQVKQYARQYASELVRMSVGGGLMAVPGGNQTSQIPQASFGFDYESGSGSGGTLRITHRGGEPVAAGKLIVTGSNLGSGNDGSWRALGGSASSQTDSGAPGVVAGDLLELTGVPSNYQVQLVYRGQTGTATLAQDRGPDA